MEVEDARKKEKERHGSVKHTLNLKIQEQGLPKHLWRQYKGKMFTIRSFGWPNRQGIPYTHHYIEGPEEADESVDEDEKSFGGKCRTRIRFEFRPYPTNSKQENNPFMYKDKFLYSFLPQDKDHADVTDFKMTQMVWKRMNFVSSATNFSFCLRNSEHLVNYIAFAKWSSNQMQMDNSLREHFDGTLDNESRKFVALLPKELRDIEEKNMDGSRTTLFDEVKGAIKFDKKLTVGEFKDINRKENKKDQENVAYNIIFAGPTGTGKSTLINLAFNETVCKVDSDTSSSVTREVTILSGMYKCKDEKEIRVNIFDTIGVCDTYLDDDEVIQDLMDAIDTDKSKVVIVCAGTIKSSHKKPIKKFLKNLQYKDNKDNFIFLYNKTEGYGDEAKKNKGLTDMGTALGVKMNHNIRFSVPDGPEHPQERIDRTFRTGVCTGFNTETYDSDCKNTFKVLTDRVLPQASDDYMERKIGQKEDEDTGSDEE